MDVNISLRVNSVGTGFIKWKGIALIEQFSSLSTKVLYSVCQHCHTHSCTNSRAVDAKCHLLIRNRWGWLRKTRAHLRSFDSFWFSNQAWILLVWIRLVWPRDNFKMYYTYTTIYLIYYVYYNNTVFCRKHAASCQDTQVWQMARKHFQFTLTANMQKWKNRNKKWLSFFLWR